MKKLLLEYKCNNSYGPWCLDDEDWEALEANGWRVIWAYQEFVYTDDGEYALSTDGLPMTVDLGSPGGTHGKYAYKRFDDPRDALVEWERITGKKCTEEGCNCCGLPHNFMWEDPSARADTYGSCSGEGCLEILFPDCYIPKDLREALDRAHVDDQS